MKEEGKLIEMKNKVDGWKSEHYRCVCDSVICTSQVFYAVNLSEQDDFVVAVVCLCVGPKFKSVSLDEIICVEINMRSTVSVCPVNRVCVCAGL